MNYHPSDEDPNALDPDAPLPLSMPRKLIQVTGVIFGELAMSSDLYTELVRDIGVRRPLPQEASNPDEYETTPTEREDEHWAKLLSGYGEY